MLDKNSTGYTISFAVGVCLICSVFVCLSAVGLKGRQEENKQLDKQKNVLKAAGLTTPDSAPDAAAVKELFKKVKPLVIDLKSGEVKTDANPELVNTRTAISKPETSYDAPANDAKVLRLPNDALVYLQMENGSVKSIILPIRGKGLWSTLYGFLALDTDTVTVKGVSFYEHGETPGLGGEVENPAWTKLWKGRKVMDASFEPAFKVKKGSAGTVAEDPNSVDGLSGATLTCNGVTALVNFWMGESGYGPFLDNFRKGGVK